MDLQQVVKCVIKTLLRAGKTPPDWSSPTRLMRIHQLPICAEWVKGDALIFLDFDVTASIAAQFWCSKHLSGHGGVRHQERVRRVGGQAPSKVCVAAVVSDSALMMSDKADSSDLS